MHTCRMALEPMQRAQTLDTVGSGQGLEVCRIWAHLGPNWGYGLGTASAQKRVKQGYFWHFSFLQCHDVSSRAAVKTAFWNLAPLAVSGKVSRPLEFCCIWAYGVGTAGAPKRAEQGFRCKKSPKPAIGLHKVCI